MDKTRLIKVITEKVTGAYHKIENTVTGAYFRIEDAFVGKYLIREGETLEQAKERLKTEE